MKASRPTTSDGVCVEHPILRETLVAIGAVWWHTRILRREVDIGSMLPPVNPLVDITVDPEVLVKRIDRIVRVLTFWTLGKRCFYRSVATACLLRRRGFPAGLDFGLRLRGHRRRQCHCWVTLQDRPLGEQTDPCTNFPIPAGKQGTAIRYWLADDGQNSDV